jgi:hypothetical protein
MYTSSRPIKSLLAVASSIFLLGSLTARAGALHVSAASATNNNVYDLTFNPPGGSSAPLGIVPLTPSSKSSVRSIVYLPNSQTGVLDLIAADFNGSSIVRYPAAAGSAIPFWTAPAAGPKSPDGLSVDSSGNLFVVRGDAGHPELWVFPRDPGKAIGAGFLAPALIDDNSATGHFGTATSTRLLETLVVPGATAAGLTPGDLLVLVNDGRVLRYSAADIKSFLKNGTKPSPATVITAKQCPIGHTPTGMAMWPADSSITNFMDSSLLVATVGGSVLRFQLTPTGSNPLNAFATGLGLSLAKIKTFTRLEGQDIVPYAVFDQPLRSKIYEFKGTPPPPSSAASGSGGCPNLKVVCNSPVAVITTVSNPVGMATTDASAPSTACTTTDPNAFGGCSLLGGSLQVSTTSATSPNTNASLLAQSCTFTDPRVTGGPGSGQCNGNTLKVSTVCSGYPDTVIPGYLCAVGPNNTMAVMKVQEKNPLTIAPSDLVVNMDVTAEGLLGTPMPTCHEIVSSIINSGFNAGHGITTAWAPLASEVATNGGSGPADYSLHPVNDQFDELGSICDAPVQRSPGHSLVLVGVEVDPSHLSGDGSEAQLVTLADNKFARLLTILNPNGSAPISSGAKTSLTQCVSKAQSYLDDTVNLSSSNRYACSARKVRECDNSLNVSTFGPNTNQLSAYSAVDGHLLNLFTHIYSRLGGNPAPATLPLPTPQPDGLCDDIAPNAPTNLAATNVTQTSLTLTWSPATGNGVAVAGYYVFRTVGTTTVGPIDAGQCATTCSYNDSGLTAGTPYQYTVKAYDTWHPAGVSPPSGALNVTTLPPLDTQKPTAPTNLRYSYTGPTTLTLSWDASNDVTPPDPYATGVGGYNVYLAGALQGSTTGTSYPITLVTTTSASQFLLEVEAVDKATPTPNVSTRASVTVTCYDPDTDHDCDALNHHHD